MKDTILAISGRPGLYRLVSQARNMLIVETIDADKKRTTVGARDKVTSLNDVTMYTTDEDQPLMNIFETIKEKLNAQPTAYTHKTATPQQLEEFMEVALPNYDRDRVYKTDIKKLLQWYNILITNGYTDFKEEEEETVEA